jgi:predicted dehydrogenase
MSKQTIGVGIIGVSPGRSWAALAHIPALQALPEYEIVALSTTRAESARAAAAEFGVLRHYDNHQELVADPEVDLVVVTVKVPHHFELVSTAIAAGKHVYCEWPLGNGLEEAKAMAALATRAGVKAVVGLQARSAPVINYVKDLVARGFVGEVLSTTLIGSGMAWGPITDRANAYTADKRNGATMLTIPFGHTVDSLCYCLGPVHELAAVTAVRRSTCTLAETGETLPLTAEDQVMVAAILAGGATAAIHYRGGASRGTNLLWEINGTEGDLQVTSIAGHAQMFDLVLHGANGEDQGLQPMAVPDNYSQAPAAAGGFAANVAMVYQQLAADLRDGTSLCPTFDDAVQNHQLIASVEESAASGQRVTLPR